MLRQYFHLRRPLYYPPSHHNTTFVIIFYINNIPRNSPSNFTYTQRFRYYSTYIQVQKTKTKKKRKKRFLNNSMILFDQVSLNGAPHKAYFWSNLTFLLKIPCKLILLSLSSYKKTLSSPKSVYASEAPKALKNVHMAD